jgi:hypothetical protein
MGAKASIQKLLDKKLLEMEKLDQQLSEIRVYIQALQDGLKLLPKEEGDQATAKELRPGSALAQVQEFLKKEGSPQHISAILQFLGRPIDKANRVSIAGSLGGYVKEKRIFTKTGPNIFGLIEFGEEVPAAKTKPAISNDDLPADFGIEKGW